MRHDEERGSNVSLKKGPRKHLHVGGCRVQRHAGSSISNTTQCPFLQQASLELLAWFIMMYGKDCTAF